MAIRPVSSVNFRNSVSFQGRKRDNRYSNASSPITHKLAIPAAALILSMYPANNISAQNDFNTDEVTALYKKTPNFEILHSRVLENWHYADGTDMMPKITVHFINTDGNDDNIENMIVEYNVSKQDNQKKIYTKVKSLKVINHVDQNNQIMLTDYAVVGESTIINHNNIRKVNNYPTSIDKKSFDYIKQFINEDVNNGALNKYIITETRDY